MKDKAKRKSPVNAIAYCAHHDRLMNHKYIHRRRCVLRYCKHMWWIGLCGGQGFPLRKPKDERSLCDGYQESPETAEDCLPD